MRFSLLILLMLCFLLSACVSSLAYQREVQQWEGKNIQALKNKWGQPDVAIRLDQGHTLYQYTRTTLYTIPVFRQRLPQVNNNLFSSYNEPWQMNQTRVLYCRTHFETNPHGDIIRISFKGNNCVALNHHF